MPETRLAQGVTGSQANTRTRGCLSSELVDLAALTESPGSLERYAEAAAKRYSVVQRDASLDQAILLASLMSLRSLDAARVALDAQPLDDFRNPPISRLVPFLASRGAFRRAFLPPKPLRTYKQAPPPYPYNYRVPLVDEVIAAPAPDRKKGRREKNGCPSFEWWNSGWASLYLVALRLAGIPPDGVFQVRLGGQDLVAVRSHRDALCIYAHELFGPDKLDLAGTGTTARFFNDAISFELDPAIHQTPTRRPPLKDLAPSRSLMDSWVSYLQEHVRDPLRWQSRREPAWIGDVAAQASPASGRDDGWSPLVFDRSTPVGELAHQIRREVFHRSAAAPGSVYTLACYAHQTLLVDRPEAYGLASLMSPAARALARRCGSPDAVLQWMRRNLADRSIFAEPDRLMLPDQVIKFRRGRALDRALLIFATTRFMGMNARVIQTTRGVYVLVHHLGRTGLIDADRMRWANSAEGVLALAFDAERTFGLRDAWSIPARNAA